MLRFKTTFFLVSSLFLLLASCASNPKISSRSLTAATDFPFWTDSLRSDKQMNRYQLSFRFKNNTITGICLIKKNGNEWRGTLMNEMGAKAFDFTVTDEKCKLINVMPMMDKWYIHKTIADDLYFLFQIDNTLARFQRKTVRFESDGVLFASYGKKQITRTPDEVIKLENMKRNILYSLMLID